MQETQYSKDARNNTYPHRKGLKMLKIRPLLSFAIIISLMTYISAQPDIQDTINLQGLNEIEYNYELGNINEGGAFELRLELLQTSNSSVTATIFVSTYRLEKSAGNVDILDDGYRASMAPGETAIMEFKTLDCALDYIPTVSIRFETTTPDNNNTVVVQIQVLEYGDTGCASKYDQQPFGGNPTSQLPLILLLVAVVIIGYLVKKLVT